jgi:antitoxin component of MazEF toxin-antitoxin module
MSKLFTAKVRKVGTSLGLLIPKEIAQQEEIKEGQEIQISLLKKRKLEEVEEMIEKMFGKAKGAKSFERDRNDRLERY